MSSIDTNAHDAARAAHDALEPGQDLGAQTPDQRMQKLADEMAQKSSNRTRKFEEGSGVTPMSDGH